MDKPPSLSTNNNLALLINNIQKTQLSLIDWQTEKLNFVPLRGSWFANSEADFDLKAEIDKFMSPQNNKKVMLLMGDSGAGKSLYTQGLVNKLWQNLSSQSHIPIWISLPSLKDPINKAIEETFEKYGFNEEQIEELRKTRSFLFILDAYDEIRCEKNLYQTNNLDQWNAKIIITCRREYLYHKDNYKLFFAPFIGDKIQYTQYEEIYIKPFNANQIQTYVQQFIQTQKPNWDNPERYQKAIEEISGLKELIKTPFMLKLVMEVLPKIVEKYATANLIERKKVTQAALYDVFIEHWFIRQEQKLKQAKQIKEDEDIKPEFWAYAKELATEMHKANLTQAVYNANEESDLFSAETKENPWVKFFSPKNPRIEFLRTSCLVRESSQYHYAFIHLSLLEYFLTRNLYDNISTQSGELTKQAVSSDWEMSNSEISKMSPFIVQPISTTNYAPSNQYAKEDYFNQRLITKEMNAIQFLADRVIDYPRFKQNLFDRIYSSKKNSANSIAAANAITILNYARTHFSLLDFSGINVQGADMSQALLHNTNLSNANLKKVNFQDAYLCGADLNNSHVDDIELGQRPLLVFKHSIHALACSSDGSYLALVDGEIGHAKDIVILRLSDDSVYCRFSGQHQKDVKCITFSPDGRLLASGCKDHIIRFWDVSRRCLFGIPLEKHTDSVASIAFSPDGKYLASGSWDKTVQLWEVATQQPRGNPLIGHSKWVTNITFSPDGNTLASGSDDHTILLWNVLSHQVNHKILKGHTDSITCISFSSDGKTLASSSNDKTVRLWDIANPESLSKSLEGHSKGVTCLAFSADSKVLATGSYDETIKLWDMATLQIIGQPLQGHTGWGPSSLVFSQDSNWLISAGGAYDGTIHRWDLIAAKQSVDKCLERHSSGVTKVVFYQNGKWIVTSSDDRTILVWDIASRKIVGKPLLHSHNVSAVAISPDSKLLASGSGDCIIRLWDLSTQKVIGKSLKGHTKGITELIFNRDGNILVSASADRTVKVWDVTTFEGIGQALTDQTDLNGIAFSPDSQFLVSDSIVWAIKKNLPSNNIRNLGYEKNLVYMSYSPSGKWLAGGTRSVYGGDQSASVLLWQVRDYKLLNVFHGHKGYVYSVSFSPNEKVLASGGGDRSVRLWSLETYQCIQVINALKKVYSLCFSPGGNLLAVATESGVGLWQCQTNEVEQHGYYLVWYAGNILLATDGLSLNGIHGLTSNNHKLLKQHVVLDIQKNSEDVAPIPLDSPESEDISLSNAKNLNVIPVKNRIAYINLIQDKEVGRGNFSVVYQGSYQHKTVAIKKLVIDKKAENINAFIDEVLISVGLQHPNVVLTYGACFEKNEYLIVMELVINGRLFDYLKDDNKYLDWPLRYLIALDIAAGLAYLHQVNIIHGDIKSANVLLDQNNRAKLCDFGSAYMKVSEKQQINEGLGKKRAGDVNWMAPELLFGSHSKYLESTTLSDVYSYGITLWEIATRKSPVQASKNQRSAYDIDKNLTDIKDIKHVSLVTPNDTPSSYANIIIQCCDLRPENRLSIDAARKALEKEYESIYKTDLKTAMSKPAALPSNSHHPAPTLFGHTANVNADKKNKKGISAASKNVVTKPPDNDKCQLM